VAQGEVEASAAKQQMDGVESLLSLLIRTAINRQFQLPDGAGFRFRKLAGAADTPSQHLPEIVPEKIRPIYERISENRSNLQKYRH
jgi:hypothetical protein